MNFQPIVRGNAANAKLIFSFFVYDTSVTTGAGLSGKVFGDFSVKYQRQGEALSAAITPQSIATIGTYAAPTANTNIRIGEIGAAAPTTGWYECQIHLDWVATTNTPAWLRIDISVTGGKIQSIEIPLCAAAGDTQLAAIPANLIQIDGLTTAGNLATLNLKQLNIVNTAGDAIVATAGGAGNHGINATGNGAGNGILATGGNSATTAGIKAVGGASGAHGLYAVGNTAGNGILATGGNSASTGGIKATGAAAAAHGIYAAGNTTGSGLAALGGATGHGIQAIGANASLKSGGSGLYAEANADNQYGVFGVGRGANDSGGIQGQAITAGEGIEGIGAGTGDGMKLVGGATSGNGLRSTGGGSGYGILSTSGATGQAGIQATGAGSPSHGIRATGGGAGNGIYAVAGPTSGAVGLAAEGSGAGAGIKATAGTTGHGLSVIGGATSGDGINATATTSGAGVRAVGISDVGLQATGGTTMAGIKASGGVATGGTAGAGLELVGGVGGALANGGDGIKATGGNSAAANSGAGMKLAKGAGLNSYDLQGATPSTNFPATVAGTVDANLVSIDGNATNANLATLNLKKLNVVNNAGDAFVAQSTGGNGSGIKATGNGTGSGLQAIADPAGNGNGLLAMGGGVSGDGMYLTSPVSGNGLTSFAASGRGAHFQGGGTGLRHGIDAIGADQGHGIHGKGGSTGSGIGADGGTNGHGIYALALTGDGIRAQVVTSGNGMNIVGAGTGEGLKARKGGGGTYDLTAPITDLNIASVASIPPVSTDVTSLLGTPITESAPGQVAGAFSSLLDVAAPTLTVDKIKFDASDNVKVVKNADDGVGTDFSAVEKASITAAVPSVTDIDTQLSGTHGAGAWDAVSPVSTDVTSILGTLITESAPGQVADAFSNLLDVAAPTLTVDKIKFDGSDNVKVVKNATDGVGTDFSAVEKANIPTVVQIDTQLSGTHGAGAWDAIGNVTVTMPVAISGQNGNVYEDGGYVYFGSKTVDGSWRESIQGTDVIFERRESGVWIQKGSFTP